MIWTARIHKTGSQVQLLKNGTVTKVIKASADTFQAYEAKKFAEDLVTNLNNKVAKQMKDPDAKPSVDSKAEVKEKVMNAVKSDAKGISPKEASIISENLALKKKIAKIEKDILIEKKARRALAITKEFVKQGKVANDENVIKSNVMKIVAMSNDEVALLEKKASNVALYNSIDEANVAQRRFARMARLHKQAAEDAELAGNTELADDEDMKAANYDSLSKEAACEADKYYKQMDSEKVDSVKPNDAASQATDKVKGVDAKGKKVASEELDEEKELEDEELEQELDDEEDDEELIEDEEEFEIEAASKIYRKIASDHRKKAEQCSAAGNETDAVVENEIADEADELADSIEVEASDDNDEDDKDDNFEVAAASKIYRKIASNHRKKAEQYVSEGKTDEAAVENEIAKEADELADSIDVKSEDEFVNKAASIYRKISSDHRKKADELEAEGKTAEADVEDEIAEEADKLAKVCDNDESELSVDDLTNVDKQATEDTTVTEVANKEAKTEDTNEQDDPLADLLSEDDLKEASAQDETMENEPSDDEIVAAVSNDYEEETEETDVSSDETADDSENEKVANEGYNKHASSDRLEQNSFSGDKQVREIENMLWSRE